MDGPPPHVVSRSGDESTGDSRTGQSLSTIPRPGRAMDWEAPADAWYVWLAVSIVSLALAGVALGLPTGAPPDASQVANTIERVDGSSHEASGRYAHDAETAVVDGRTIELTNEHGTSYASLDYGVIVPVTESERLANLSRGAAFDEEYRTELADPDVHAGAVFLDDVADEYAASSGTEVAATGELAVRRIGVDADADDLADHHERVTITAAEETHSRVSGVGTVTADYVGVEGASIDLEAEGTLRYYGSSTADDDATTATSTTASLAADLTGGHVTRPASEPVTVTVESDAGLSERIELDAGETETVDHATTRSVDLDTDEPYVDRHPDTETYYVTLVTV